MNDSQKKFIEDVRNGKNGDFAGPMPEYADFLEAAFKFYLTLDDETDGELILMYIQDDLNELIEL